MNDYEILGVQPGISEKELKSVYRKLASQYHPDKNGGSKDSEEKFKQISEAYNNIKSGKTQDPRVKQTRKSWWSYEDFIKNTGNPFEFNFEFGEEHYTYGGERRTIIPDIRFPLNLTMTVPIEIEEFFKPFSREIQYNRRVQCPTCKGSGLKRSDCKTCNGKGYSEEIINEKFKFPKGVPFGSSVKFEGYGNKFDEKTGFLQINISLKQNSLNFDVNQNIDIIKTFEIDILEFALGFKKKFTKCDGTEVEVKIPSMKALDMTEDHYIKEGGIPRVGKITTGMILKFKLKELDDKLKKQLEKIKK